jgi:hypothetical protein
MTLYAKEVIPSPVLVDGVVDYRHCDQDYRCQVE